MTRKFKRCIVILCSGVICVLMFSTAGTIGTEASGLSQVTTVTEVVDADIDYDTGKEYDIVFPAQTSASTAFDYPYLESALSNTPVVWQDRPKNLRAYDLNDLQLNIPKLDRLVEVSFNDGTYNISFFRTTGEFVILEYFSDGTINRYVRESGNGELDDRPTDADVIFYDGADNSVKRYQ